MGQTVERGSDTTVVEPTLLTIRAAAQRFSVSYDFVHDAILEGDLPALRPSRQWLVKPGDVLSLIERRSEQRAAS